MSSVGRAIGLPVKRERFCLPARRFSPQRHRGHRAPRYNVLHHKGTKHTKVASSLRVTAVRDESLIKGFVQEQPVPIIVAENESSSLACSHHGGTEAQRHSVNSSPQRHKAHKGCVNPRNRGSRNEVPIRSARWLSGSPFPSPGLALPLSQLAIAWSGSARGFLASHSDCQSPRSGCHTPHWRCQDPLASCQSRDSRYQSPESPCQNPHSDCSGRRSGGQGGVALCRADNKKALRLNRRAIGANLPTYPLTPLPAYPLTSFPAYQFPRYLE
jgi:hypothetical protein